MVLTDVSLKMVIKLFFFRNQYNLISFSANKILRHTFCSLAVNRKSQIYKYLLILDFEATCDRAKLENREIIEFPCLKINAKTLSEEGRFHHYVKPVLQPILPEFCIQLTGILQEMVNESKTFPEVYHLFEQWREQEGLTDENSVYITSGDWDLGHMMPRQCNISNLEIPSHMKKWIDIKKLFGNHETFYNSFADIMKHYHLDFRGKLHSGIDDCLNILQVVKKMALAGIEFKPTSRLAYSKVETISEFQRKYQLTEGPSVLLGKFCKRQRHRKMVFKKDETKEKNQFEITDGENQCKATNRKNQ